MHLATLIDTAICLKKLRIRKQQGNREVRVSIEYAMAASGDAHADASKQGCITVKAKRNDTVICMVPTAKTARQEVEIKQWLNAAAFKQAIRNSDMMDKQLYNIFQFRRVWSIQISNFS